MKFRFHRLAVLLTLPFVCRAMDTSELPEVLATVNGVPIRRDELTAELAPQLSRLELARDRAKVRDVVRRSVDYAICRRLLSAEFEKYGIALSRAEAEKYLAEMLLLMPPASRKTFEAELSPRLDTADFQLKAAVHAYLERRFTPAALAVSAAEIGRYYELNRLRYRQPERWDIGVIRIDRRRRDAAGIAASARARLLQGENFERVARELDPEGAGGRLPQGEIRMIFAAELAGMSAGDVSRVVTTQEAFYVILLRSRESGGEMPLAEVAPIIVMEISAAKDVLALRKVLTEFMAAAQIVWDPFFDPGSPEPSETAPHSAAR